MDQFFALHPETDFPSHINAIPPVQSSRKKLSAWKTAPLPSASPADALVPGTEARAVAEQEANATGKLVTIRNPVTDEVLATVRPASVEQPSLKVYAAPHRAAW